MFIMDIENCNLSYKSLMLNIPPQETALLGVYLKAWLENWPGAGPKGYGENHQGWINTSDFIIPSIYKGYVFQTYINLYAKALRNRDPAPLERLFHLSHKDPTALQQFFQRKRTLLDRILKREAHTPFTDLRLKSSRTKPHRAGVVLPRQHILLK